MKKIHIIYGVIILSLLALTTGSLLSKEDKHDEHEGHDHAKEEKHDEHKGHGPGCDHAKEVKEEAKEEKHDEHERHDHAKKEKHDEHEGHGSGCDHAKEVKEKHDEHEGHDHAKEEKHDEHEGHDHGAENTPLIKLTEEQKKMISLKLEKPIKGKISQSIRLTGEIKFNAERKAHIMPRMPGFVTNIYKNFGDKVKKGDVLALIQSHELGELFGEYYSKHEQVKLAKAEYDRQNKLMARKVISEKVYIAAKHEYQMLNSELHRAEDKLKSLGFLNKQDQPTNCLCEGEGQKICTTLEIKTPIDGTIIKKDITLGENFPEDNEKVAFVIANISTVWLDLNAYQKDLPFLKTGQKVTVVIGKQYPNYKGKISYIAPFISPETRTALIRIVLNNKDGKLRPGLFATAIISIGENAQSLNINRNAIQRLDKEDVVFVPKGDGFSPIPVTTGKSNNGRIEIISGLKPEENYVGQGAFELKSILVTSGIDPHAGHGH